MRLRNHLSPLRLGQLTLLALGAMNLVLISDNVRLRSALSGGVALADAAKAPEFVLPLVGSKKNMSLRDVAGREGTLLFFSPDCSVCQSEASQWNQLAQIASEDGRFFVGICCSASSRAEQFCRDNGLDFPVVADEAGAALKSYRVPGVPFSYVIDKSGRVGYERSATEANCLRLGFTR